MTVPTDGDLHNLVLRVADRLMATDRRLVTAESCTGGWVAKACTDLPGSSRWFRGGVVAYDNEFKAALLGVPRGTLVTEGAVSQATAARMR